jgi:hypothetical protein
VRVVLATLQEVKTLADLGVFCPLTAYSIFLMILQNWHFILVEDMCTVRKNLNLKIGVSGERVEIHRINPRLLGY